jgi:HK97 family phage major capsid protein/HK97 family phage prohead protease
MPETIEKMKPLRRFLENVEIVVRKENGTNTLSFPAASEAPVERWYGTEVLSLAAGAVKLDRAAAGAMPLLFNHNMDDPIGMIDGAHIAGNRLIVDAHLFATARAQEIKTMIEGGLSNVSIGYRNLVVEENIKTDTYVSTSWEPFEVSIVTVPADATVGIGRALSEENEVRILRTSKTAVIAEGAIMADEATATGAATAGNVPIAAVNAVDLEKARKRAIETLCKANKLDEKYREHWISTGLSLENVAEDILRILEERGKSNPQPVSRLGLTAQETQRFSLTRAIRAISEKDWKNAQFELECSRAIAERMGRVAEPHKFYVPFEVMERPVDQKRDLTVATAGAGGYLVETQNMGFIEMLRNRSVAFRMGVRRLSGLNGSVTIPRQSAAATAYWLANEATTITESQQTFVQMALTPKTVGAYTEISRQLLLQSSPGAEGIVTDDLAQQVALAADLAVLNGSGASGQPTGIISTAGIGAVTGTSLGYPGILEFQSDVAGSNVMPMAGGYVTTPAVAALLMGRQRFTSTDTPLWDGNVWDGSVSGFRGMSSNQMPAANMLFGDWQEVVVGEWGVLEVEVNPYANFQAGIIGVRAIYSMDVGVRRPFAFSLATTIT